MDTSSIEPYCELCFHPYPSHVFPHSLTSSWYSGGNPRSSVLGEFKELLLVTDYHVKLKQISLALVNQKLSLMPSGITESEITISVVNFCCDSSMFWVLLVFENQDCHS